MRSWTLFSWFKDFFKEWLLPKGATAIAVFMVSRVIFSLPLTTDLGQSATKHLEKIFKSTGSDSYLYALLVAATAFGVSLILRQRANGERRINLPVRSMLEISAKGLVLLLGLLVVPLVVATAAFWEISGGWSSPEVKDLLILIAIVTLMSAGAHTTAAQDNEPYEVLTYTISANTIIGKAEFSYSTSERTSQLMAGMPHMLETATSIEAYGLYTAINIGFGLKAQFWNREEIERLALFLGSLEREWKATAYTVELSGSRALIDALSTSADPNLSLRSRAAIENKATSGEAQKV